jgi:dihydrofolate reductase
MIISCIVATAHDRVIGKDNDIPWYLPADLQYFKKVTLNHHILMGRNCYASIGRPLPKRTNVIITRDPFFLSSNCLVARSITEAIDMASMSGDDEIFIIGGGQIYQQTEDLWDKLYLTEVDVHVQGDIYFPEINLAEWDLVSEESHHKDEKNEYDYCFKVLTRR